MTPKVEKWSKSQENRPENRGHKTKERIEEGDQLGKHKSKCPRRDIDQDPDPPKCPISIKKVAPRTTEYVDEEHLTRDLATAATSDKDGRQAKTIRDLDHDGRQAAKRRRLGILAEIIVHDATHDDVEDEGNCHEQVETKHKVTRMMHFRHDRQVGSCRAETHKDVRRVQDAIQKAVWDL